MTKKKVSFLNPNFQAGPKEFNAYYLPYTAGVLWSYVSQFDHISNEYELGEFIWKREPIAEVAERLQSHDVICISSYVWNRNYNHVLGQEIKKRNPNALIVLGGPEPPITRSDLFVEFPYVDICVKQEGEKALKFILEKFSSGSTDFSDISGLLLNVDRKVVDTGQPSRIGDLDEIPSPYLTGIFDHLFDSHPEVRWNVTIETNRGCPYMCTFCDWGSLTYSKIKKYNIDKVFAEIEWVGQRGCDFISFTDANFGIFPERDMSIAKKLVEVQLKYDNPKAYTMTWAKNQKKEVVDIVKVLTENAGSKIGLNLSVQTMDEHTLEVIKRKNLDTNRIEEVFALCEESGIPLHTELILGLPGQTLATWKNDFHTLYKAGNHTGIAIYQAQLLENAEMSLTQREEYQLEGRIVYDYLVGAYNDNELSEGIEVIFATRDLPTGVMVEAQMYSWFQNTFHINGITPYISRFLYKKHGIEYATFYDKLLEHIKQDEWFSKEYERIKGNYVNWATKGYADHEPIRGIEIPGWNLIHSTTINISDKNMHDHVFNVIEDFLRKNFELEESILNDLILLQRNYFINYNKVKEYPKTVEFTHDVLGYVLNDADLDNSVSYQFDFPEDKNISLQTFCELLYYARRRNFGKAKVTSVQQQI